jgi:hypothetical protein
MRCSSVRSGADAKDVEKAINEWLKNNPGVTIRFVTQAERASRGWIITTFFYD